MKYKEGVVSMVELKQRKVDATGKQYIDTLRVPDQAVAKRGEQAQQGSGELSQQFFKAAIDQHQHQVKAAQQITQIPVATYMNFAKSMFSFTQVSVESYMKFANSMFSFSNGSVKSTATALKEAKRSAEEAHMRAEEAERQVEQAQRRTEEAERRAEEAERSSSEAESQGDDDLPLADYDSLNIRQISERLDELSVEEIRGLRDYEVRNKDRSTLVNRLNSRIEVSS